MINGLDLFSGIGGLSIALREWVKPVAYCEIDPYCQGVLLSRISDGSLPNGPIWDDIKTLSYDGRNWPGVNIIYGGFPCQDISVAGNGKGLEGERSGLFFEIIRLAKEIKPTFIFLENVPAICTRGGMEVVRKVAEMGYDCRWCTISAASVGALHRRERWFLLAHAKHDGTSTREKRTSTRKESSQGEQHKPKESFRKVERASCISSNVANFSSKRLERFGKRAECAESKESLAACDGTNVSDTRCQCEGSEKKPKWPSIHFAGCDRFWETEPEVGRLADGIPDRMDKLKCLGNAVVPKQAKEAFKILMGINEDI